MATTKQAQVAQLEIPPAAKGSTIASTLMQEGPQYLTKANALQVSNAAEHKSALELLGEIANRKKTVEEERVKITNPLHLAWKNTNTFFAALLSPFAQVDGIVRPKVLAYEKAEKDKAAAAQKLLDDAAEKERNRIAAQAREAERVANENARLAQVEADRKKREAADAQAAADAAAKAGDTEAAKTAQAQAVTATKAAARLETRAESIANAGATRAGNLNLRASSIVAPIVQAPDLKAAGKSDRRVWKWKVKDAAKIDRKFLAIDEAKINALVRSMKGEAAELVGEGAIEVWDEPDLSIKAKP